MIKQMNRLAACALLGAGIAGVLCVGGVAMADDQPSAQMVASAQKTSELMLATVFAALGQEFAETTPENVPEGKKSISLIFNDKNKDMRLVGVLNPLQSGNVPQDAFETTALAMAMNGENYTSLQRVDGRWYYRRSTAVSNFHASCSMCHSNFGPVNPAQWTGALMLRVPVGGGE